jgi:hypothetical protein
MKFFMIKNKKENYKNELIIIIYISSDYLQQFWVFILFQVNSLMA